MDQSERIYQPLDNETVLSGILFNTRLRLMQASGAYQLAALMSPREGHPDSDAIPFTCRSCAMVHQYLRDHGILCVRVRTHGPRQDMYSIITATDPAALERLLETARRVTRRTAMTHRGLKLDVLDGLDGTAAA